ncbi:MAG: site-specific DNA-methyltransferase [Thermodesulfobacteriota bacterium]|jgi:site-specific DNA-methyltransferase (adenine-specific)
MSRHSDIKKILASLGNSHKFTVSRGILINGDSLEILKKFPDHLISLIITDPPYHTTKKKNIYGDTTFKEDEQYLAWMSKYAKEWERILRPNGSLFVFCSPSMVGRLECMLSLHFNILSQIVWTKPNDPGFDGWKQKMNKESLRQWYDHSERIIFAEPAMGGNLRRSYFGNLLKENRLKSGLSTHNLTEIIGAYGKVNHGGAVSNWEAGRNVPSEEQYNKIRKALLATGRIKSMPNYFDVIRPFFVNKSKEFTDIWTFPNIRPYKGKHPAEKPVELLELAILATTFQDDIVLDCFAGSGSTAVAALKLGRYSISVEIEKKWSEKIEKLLVLIEDNKYNYFPNNYDQKFASPTQYQHELFTNE